MPRRSRLLLGCARCLRQDIVFVLINFVCIFQLTVLSCFQIVDEDGNRIFLPTCGASPVPLTRCLSGLGDAFVAPLSRTLSVREESPVGAKRALSDLEVSSLDEESIVKKLDTKPESATE